MFEMDRDAFEELYAEHARPLVRFLMYRTGDAALAEDIAADTFERVLRARRSFDPRKASKKTRLRSTRFATISVDSARRRGRSTGSPAFLRSRRMDRSRSSRYARQWPPSSRCSQGMSAKLSRSGTAPTSASPRSRG